MARFKTRKFDHKISLKNIRKISLDEDYLKMKDDHTTL